MLKLVAGIGGGESPVDGCRSLISFGYLSKMAGRGTSLFVDRNKFDIIFLESRNGREFITGDQPIVNLLGTGDGSEPPDLAFYYPLSPVLSCLVSPKKYGFQGGDIPCAIVEELNELIASESKQFLVARSDTVLHHILNKPSLARPATRAILDFLVKGHA